jgi:hypothetical protein
VVRDKASKRRPVDCYPPGAGCETVRIMHAGLTLAHRLETAMSGLMKTSHQLRFSRSRAVRLAFALLCFVGSAGFAPAASVGAQSPPSSSPQVTSQFAIGDFDGDRQPDLATVHAGQSSSLDTQYWIAFQLSSGPRRILSITAPAGGLHIKSRDVNGDDFLDVIVTTAWTNRPVAVLLNDGQGNFRSSSPSAFPEAFTTSEKSRASATDEVRDATAVLLSRYPTGDSSEGSRRLSSPRNVTGLLVALASCNSPFSSVVPFLGRAPPSFVLHI